MTLVRGRYNLNYSKGKVMKVMRETVKMGIITYCKYIVRLEFRERWRLEILDL